ncbi:hypothetical protein P7H17_18000 [Paenibacillus larvae]|nr:hypothetical protein [Paenibacillus larvae]MDT2287564.1 hypothetical protein [Paenibacillus larvae]
MELHGTRLTIKVVEAKLPEKRKTKLPNILLQEKML